MRFGNPVESIQLLILSCTGADFFWIRSVSRAWFGAYVRFHGLEKRIQIINAFYQGSGREPTYYFFPRSSLLNAFFEGLETHMAFHMAQDFCERKRLICVSDIVRYSSEYGISLGRLSFCSKSSSISFLGIRHPGPAKDIILALKAPAISCDLWSSKQKHNKVPETCNLSAYLYLDIDLAFVLMF